MATLSEIVSRRSDLGTFVVHITRHHEGRTAKANLTEIIKTGKIIAHSPFGSAVKALEGASKKGQVSADDMATQKAVCFTETPLEHLHLMLATIEDVKRDCEFGPYGIAITKKVARQRRVNPIWYVDITPGHDWLILHVNNLVEDAISKGNFAKSDIAKLTPFIEQMGTGEGYRKEFWWEREWRHRGNFVLPDTVIALAPEEEHEEFAKIIESSHIEARLIDPRWGLEAIIARLAGFEPEDVGPF